MPTIKFKKNRVLEEDQVVEAEDGDTILEVAESRGIPVGSNCGGVCGCSTCHVYVLEGFDSLEEMEEPEEDRLDLGFDVRLNSRLGCQARVNGEDLVVDITEESLKAYFDENPDIRKHYEATGEFKFVPHSHSH
jgi:2Fe-2S ferredoxin